MAENDYGSGRIEPRPLMVGRGIGTTPERIEELQRRQRDLQRIRGVEPSKPFSEVLQAGRRKNAEGAPGEEAGEEVPAQKGPRPGLSHPGQKEEYGRQGGGKVVLKG